MSEDRNSLAFWFPRIEAVGLRVPRTEIVFHHGGDLIDLLDGVKPKGWDLLVANLRGCGDDLGWPCFLRTGHGSGKHQWRDTCFVPSPSAIPAHVGRLVEWSHSVDLMGLPTDVWAIREMLPTAPLFTCLAYDGFPVVREFRLFVRDGEVEHSQPYWPPEAVEQGGPDASDWRSRLTRASRATQREYAAMCWAALAAVEAVGGGYWSVDLLEDRDGQWWLTDMAEGDRSFRWEVAA